MVGALGPGKFYGSSLPRPRFYTDIKFNDERVDPPPSVMDPLLRWAADAHWSMGGLNLERRRLQGRIEGNVEKLRAQREKISSSVEKQKKSAAKLSSKSGSKKDRSVTRVSKSPSPPPAPVAIKRRRVLGLVDEEEDGEDLQPGMKGVVRNLRTDFERVAVESGMPKSNDAVTSTSNSEKNDTTVGSAAVNIRSSPRLAKRRVTA